VAIQSAGGSRVFTGATVPGVKTVTYSVKALSAGTYTFFCTIHNFMTGILTVR
jgi:plastocyanin